MRAAVITRPGGPEVLEVHDLAPPEVGAQDVLVRVHASGINRADLLQRQGRYPAPAGSPEQVPGLEYAGEVVEVGRDVTTLTTGDRVFGISGGGAHAEMVAVPAATAAPLPESLDWVSAGAIPEAYITAHDALVTQARMRPGERVLIHAVGSGVGLAALQLVRALGAVPFGTSRTADKIDRARDLGLEAGAVIRDPAEIAGQIRAWGTGDTPSIDIVLDLVGGDYTAASLDVLRRLGRLMLVGLVGGSSTRLDLRRVLSGRITIIGTVLRSRSVEEKAAATAAFARDVVPLLATNAVRATVDSVFPLERIAEAHRQVESNATFGKVVVTM